MKNLRMPPDFGAVVAHKNRDVAHYADATLTASRVQLRPLLEKYKLDDAFDLQLAGGIAPNFFERRRVAANQFGRPGIPRDVFKTLAQNIEENEIFQPSAVLGAEALKCATGLRAGVLEEIPCSFAQQRHFQPPHRRVIYIFRRAGQRAKAVVRDPGFIGQPFQAYA